MERASNSGVGSGIPWSPKILNRIFVFVVDSWMTDFARGDPCSTWNSLCFLLRILKKSWVKKIFLKKKIMGGNEVCRIVQGVE